MNLRRALFLLIVLALALPVPVVGGCECAHDGQDCCQIDLDACPDAAEDACVGACLGGPIAASSHNTDSSVGASGRRFPTLAFSLPASPLSELLRPPRG